MYDGTLMFDTGIDNSGFKKDVNILSAAASVAVGNIAANMASEISSAIAQIPQQVIAVGSEFEASMSQVAATMGITSASAEFDKLSEAAKEMGESTKFSAAQAGSALNFLALAGYDAEKSVAALPTVLNVAAAGGMELADASDMITDAMSALGLETSQMADFADKLAVTSQKSNTSVSQLGQAILTVGGTAKTLSGGVAEMNTALGILADNGIKGAEGGTALRNVILSLSAPTSTAAAELSNLGVSAFDAQGNMRPLQETFADLDTALSKLTQQQKTEALNNIFNKVDLKSVNALLGTSSERFDELSGYINDCAGAAEQMAETMDDNLKGDLTIMQSALQGLGIAVYEDFEGPLRKAVQGVTTVVGDLTAAWNLLSSAMDSPAEKAKRIIREYDEQSKKLSDLETELESVRDRISEIQSMGTLSITDEQELENLQLQNAELSTRLEIERELLRLKNIEKSNAAAEAVMSANSIDSGSISYVERQIDLYNQWEKAREDWYAELESASTEEQAYILGQIDGSEEKMSTYKLMALEGMKAVNELSDSLDTTTQKGQEAASAIEEMQKETTELFGIGSSGSNAGSLSVTPTAESALSAAKSSGEAMSEYYSNYYRNMAETAAEAQKEATEKLKAEWKSLEHQYAVGVIASESELYAKKQAVFNEYGSKDLEDHWKYYEDLMDYQKDYAKKAAEEDKKAREDYKKSLNDEWNNISRLQSMGVISAEDAYRAQLAFIQKYCSEYSDEWYDYYQTVIEYQRNAQQEQVKNVKSNISKLVSEYKSAYKEIESSRNSYKNKLMSVGDLFNVETKTDKNGKKTTVVSVENMRKQMAEMKKYHSYITKLKKSGASQSLLDELTAMDFEEGSFAAKNLANMSKSEFDEINELYKQKEELAGELSAELYKPEMDKINENLVNGILDEFGTLPSQIQAIGMDALTEFAAGLTEGDISEQVNKFAEKFVTDCTTGIQQGFAGTELDYSALMSADTYSMGKAAGDDYAAGFNEAMAQIQAAVASEHYTVSAEYAAKAKSAGGAISEIKGAAERIIVENHNRTELYLDSEKVAEKVTVSQSNTNRRKGK